MLIWWTLSQLRSPDAAKRASAAERLGKAPQPRVTTALLKVALSDSSPEVIEAAARSLRQHGNAEIVLLLIRMLSQGDRFARPVRAARILTLFGPTVVPPLIAALGSDHPYIVLGSIEILGNIGEARAIDAIASAARRTIGSREDERDKAEAALVALERIGGDAAVEHLILLGAARERLKLVNPDWKRAAGASRALPRLLSGKCVGYSEILGEIGDKRAIPVLLDQILESEFLPNSFWSSLERIDPDWGRLEEVRRRTPQFTAALESGDPWRARIAAQILAKIKDPCAVPALIRVMTDDSHANESTSRYSDAQRAAVAALGEIGGSQAIEALTDVVLGDGVGHREAKAALDRLDPGWLRTHPGRLVVALKSKERFSLALIESEPARSSLPLLLPLLNERQLRTRIRAAKAVVQIEPRSAEKHLEGWASDREYLIRWSRAHLLKDSKGREVPSEYKSKNISWGRAFCFGCGIDIEAEEEIRGTIRMLQEEGIGSRDFDQAPLKAVIDGVPEDSFACESCQRLLCGACAGEGERCPACHDNLEVAKVGMRFGFSI